LRVIRVEQFAVLDEQQGVRHHRRNRREIGVALARETRREERRAGAIEQLQAGGILFAIGQEQPQIGELDHFRR
jgi:hypothetical protein